jgi:hypothetical protein
MRKEIHVENVPAPGSGPAAIWHGSAESVPNRTTPPFFKSSISPFGRQKSLRSISPRKRRESRRHDVAIARPPPKNPFIHRFHSRGLRAHTHSLTHLPLAWGASTAARRRHLLIPSAPAGELGRKPPPYAKRVQTAQKSPPKRATVRPASDLQLSSTRLRPPGGAHSWTGIRNGGAGRGTGDARDGFIHNRTTFTRRRRGRGAGQIRSYLGVDGWYIENSSSALSTPRPGCRLCISFVFFCPRRSFAFGKSHALRSIVDFFP